MYVELLYVAEQMRRERRDYSIYEARESGYIWGAKITLNHYPIANKKLDSRSIKDLHLKSKILKLRISAHQRTL